MSTSNAEITRIRSAYARRDRDGKAKLYGWRRQDSHFNRYRLYSFSARMLDAAGLANLHQVNALDIGCGSGQWLRELASWGVPVANLYGIDLLPDRLVSAKSMAPGMGCILASALDIPLRDRSVDLMTAHTVFSSVLDPDIRRRLAADMQRVLSDTGAVLVYDYRVSDPRNPDTVGIRFAEMRRLFPGTQIRRRLLTLAPPIARRLAPLSTGALVLTEVLFPFLRTHALYLIRKRPETDNIGAAS